MPKQEIKTYKKSKDFEKDAKRRNKKGWRVLSQSASQPRAGIRRIGLLGIFAFLFKPKPEITVIYERD